MTKKVLILGSQGTLGQALIKEFTGSDYEVVGWDKDDLDITSDQAAAKIEELKPNIIINSTGYNSADKAQNSPEEAKLAFILNSDVPGRLAALSKKIDAVFINFSTDYVFKGDKKEGYIESDIPSPESEYAKSKYEGEKQVQKNGDKYYIVRPSRIFGEKGASPTSKRSFVEIMLAEIDKEELMVKNEDVSCPTYAPDLAKFIKKLIEGNYPYGIYHGANSGVCTWYEWAAEIFKVMRKGPKLIPGSAKDYPNTAPHPAYSELKNTKLPLQRSWQEALAEFLKG